MRYRQVCAASLQFGFFVMPYASQSAYVPIRKLYSFASVPWKCGTLSLSV